METWKSVVGWESVYEVSDLGRIRRIKPAQGTRVRAIVKQTKLRHGYLRVKLSNNNVQADATVHSLVAIAFIGPRPEGHDVNHKDGQKSNNRADNIEWMPHSDNMRHAFRAGLIRRSGEHNASHKLTSEDVIAIRSSDDTAESIAARFGVTPMTVRAVRRRAAWSHI